MDNEKAKSKSVTLTPSLWEDVEKYAFTFYGGNRSQYIKDLIKADLKNKNEPSELPTKENENMFIDLCEMMTGYTATERAKKAFNGLKGRVSQRRFLEHILTRASLAARWLNEHPNAYYDGLRFQYSDSYSETYSSLKSSSASAKSVPILKVV